MCRPIASSGEMCNCVAVRRWQCAELLIYTEYIELNSVKLCDPRSAVVLAARKNTCFAMYGDIFGLYKYGFSTESVKTKNVNEQL